MTQTNKMVTLNLPTGDIPMEGTLCTFMNKEKLIMMLGYLVHRGKGFSIKAYALSEYFAVDTFTHYHYVLNEKGGFYFLTDKEHNG